MKLQIYSFFAYIRCKNVIFQDLFISVLFISIYFIYLPCPIQKLLTAKPGIWLSNDVHRGTKVRYIQEFLGYSGKKPVTLTPPIWQNKCTINPE